MPNSSADFEPIPLSHIAEWGYCPRRCGLIMLDEAWQENEYTTSGELHHERVHTDRIEKRSRSIQICDFAVSSDTLGISGKCDCIEAYPNPNGVMLPFAEGLYTLYPIEYKNGVVRNEREYNMQLCAQAMCLEERFGCTIPEGAIFYIDDHRRSPVQLNDELRQMVIEAVRSIREMMTTRRVPQATAPQTKCKKCAMQDICMPQIAHTASAYLKELTAYLQRTE